MHVLGCLKKLGSNEDRNRLVTGFYQIPASFTRSVCIFESGSIQIFARQGSVGICGCVAAHVKEKLKRQA